MNKVVKVFIEKVVDLYDFIDAYEVFMEWFMGHLLRSGYKFEVDERDGSIVVFDVEPWRLMWRPKGEFDAFEFVVNEAEYIVDVTYHIGAYVLISVCNNEEDECVNLYLSDIRRIERDELPIVGP
jgi:hypothetical protein